ncbi:MAG: hypothetical protein GF387_03285 [Candidatus Portnoybacteria bacterium]|nr:hypothetical protein [Candidatus Portnoybacteria bacterium]
MQISKKLPQFNNEKAILVIAGMYGADFYNASDGVIEKVDEFRISEPTYSDREGHFQVKGRGKRFGSGSVYEPKKQKVINVLLNEFDKHFDDIVSSGDSFYLFSPEYISNEFEKEISDKFKKKIKRVIHGNYLGEHPFSFLKKLGKIQDKEASRKKVVPTPKEAWKILKKSKVARKIIGKK